MKSTISLIVPIYNVAPYLEECLESIAAQTHPFLDIILVDDGSTDGSGLICKRFSERDARVRVISRENGGPAKARNTGIEAAKGEFLCFVDGDDRIAPEFCARAMAIFQKTDADIVMFDIGRFCDGEDVFSVVKNPICAEGMTSQTALVELMRGKIHDSLCNKVYKKHLFEEVRCLEGHLWEDIGTTYRLFLRAKCIHAIPETLYFYRKRKGSIVSHMTDDHLCDIFLMRYTRYRELLAVDPAASSHGLYHLSLSALALYDRSLWSRIERTKLREAVDFLQTHRAEILRLSDIGRLRFYLLFPSFYRMYRRLRHGLGWIWKRIFHVDF